MENIKKLRHAERENSNLRDSLLLSGTRQLDFFEKLLIPFIYFSTITGNTVLELQARVQRAENSLAMYIENQKMSNRIGKQEYFESHQMNTAIKIENKQIVENELTETKERLAQCEMNLKIRDNMVEKMAEEIEVLQRKREKRNIDMKMLLYDKKQLELRLTENSPKKKIHFIELQ